MGADQGRASPVPRVLVVEDETLVQMLVLDVVSDLGFETLEASDGPSALEVMAASPRIDLLITDVGLPGMSGRKLAETARALNPSLKVLFVTGYADRPDIDEGLGDGVAVIIKPFALDDLAQKVSSMVATA